MRAPSSLALVVALTGVASGCGVFTSEEPCTLIGCRDGLLILLDENPGEQTRVVVDLPDGSSREAVCSGGADCSALFFAEVQAANVVVHITVGDGPTRTIAAELTYEDRFPNGPDCEPECSLATLRVVPLGPDTANRRDAA